MPERAEIEAVARTLAEHLMGDDSLGWVNFTWLAGKVITKLDRVRDARDDDEAQYHAEHQGEGREFDGRCGLCRPELRFPQGEDHGPEPDALGGLPPSQPKEDDERRH